MLTKHKTTSNITSLEDDDTPPNRTSRTGTVIAESHISQDPNTIAAPLNNPGHSSASGWGESYTVEDDTVEAHPMAATDVFPLAEEQTLEVDEFDSDSALGSDVSSTTTSVTDSIYNFRREHGRTYHAYKDGKYIFPNDEREADRLDLQHHLFCLTFGEHLFFSPIKNPKRCIDVGTGTGIWALDFADQFPNCQVMGIDLSPGQPTLVPPNLTFIIDDAEDPWVYDEPFDFIHARLMAGCFVDWPGFFRQSFENLQPGGWLEVQDYGLPVKSSDGTATNTNLMRWDCSEHYVRWMQQAGFVDVELRMFMWPSNSWPKNPLMKELGRWNQVNILDGLEGFCLALLTRGLGWTKAEVDIFVAKVSHDLCDRKIHAYFPMPVVFGRRPMPGEV